MAQLQKEPPKLTKAEIDLAIVCVATSSSFWDSNGLMNPPPLNAPFEDKAIWLLKELERLKKIPKWKEIMDILDAIPDPKRLEYSPFGIPPPDAPKSKEVDINTIKMYPWR